MIETIIILFHMSIFVGFITLAMHADVAERRIPNRLTAMMAAVGAVYLLFSGPSSAALFSTIAVAFAVLGGGGLLSYLGIWGGGDAKLVAASAIWLGPVATPLFIGMVPIIGALQAVLTLSATLLLTFRAVPGARWRPRLLARRITLPYAVSIGLAAIVAMTFHIAVAI